MDRTSAFPGTATPASRWSAQTGRKTNVVYPKMFMVVVGTLGSGFEFYGLFKDVEGAGKWIKENLTVGTYVRIERFHVVRDDQ